MRRRAHDAKDRAKNRVKTRVQRHTEEGSTIGTTCQIVSRGVAAAQTLKKGIIDESLWLSESQAELQTDSSDICTVSPLSAAPPNRVKLYLPEPREGGDDPSEGEIISIKDMAVLKAVREVTIEKSEEETELASETLPAPEREKEVQGELDDESTVIRNIKSKDPETETFKASTPPDPARFSKQTKLSANKLDELVKELDFKLRDPMPGPASPTQDPLDKTALIEAEKPDPPAGPTPEPQVPATGWAHRKLHQVVEAQHRVIDLVHDRVHDKAAALNDRAHCLFPIPSSSVGPNFADTTLDNASDIAAHVSARFDAGTGGSHPADPDCGDSAVPGDCSRGSSGAAAGADPGCVYDLKDYKPKYAGPPAKTAAMLSHWETEFGHTQLERCQAPIQTHRQPTAPKQRTPRRWGHERVQYYGVM